MNKKAWEYTEGEVIIWVRCACIQCETQNHQGQICNLWKYNGSFMGFYSLLHMS